MEKELSTDYQGRFEACYSRFYKPVRIFIDRMVGCESTASDLAHDTFVRLYEKKVDIFDLGPTGVAYLYTVARNVTVDYIKKSKSERKRVKQLGIQEVVLNKDFFQSLEEAYIEDETVEEMEKAFEELPLQSRRIFICRSVHGMPYNKVKEQEGMSFYHLKQVERDVARHMRSRLKGIVDHDQWDGWFSMDNS